MSSICASYSDEHNIGRYNINHKLYRVVEDIRRNEVKQKEKEKQEIFDALPGWKKRLILENKSS